MDNKRILAGIALTAGLGLTGVATAPVSGAATPHSATAAHAQPAKASPGHKGGRPKLVCVIRIDGHGGKPGGTAKLPPLPPLPPLTGKPGKADRPGKGTAKKITVKVVNGKVYINGKPAPKGSVPPKGGCPPLPPIPPKGGKAGGGVVIVQRGEGGMVTQGAPGAGAGEAGLTTSGASDSAVLG